MSDLRTLFISQSYTSLIHTSNDAAVPTGSYIELEDGSGNSLGIEVNRDGNFKVQGELSASLVNGIGNVTAYSASVDSRINNISTGSGADITALNDFTASQLTINDGYNQFTESYYTDSASFDSRIDGIVVSGSGADWNVNLFNIPNGLLSSSVNFNTYTQSVDNRLDSLETFTGSLSTDFVDTGSFNLYTSSTDNRLDSIETTTASLQSQIDNISIDTGSLLETASFDNNTRNITFTKADTSTFDLNIPGADITALNDFTSSQLNINSGYNTFTESADNRLNNIELATGSYATTGSNFFTGNQVLTANNGTFSIGEQSNTVAFPNMALWTSEDDHPSYIYSSFFIQNVGNLNGTGFEVQGPSGSVTKRMFIDGEITIEKDADSNWFLNMGTSIMQYSSSADFYIYPNVNLQGGVDAQTRSTFFGGLEVQNGFTASLSEGNVWVGNSLGKTTQITTGSLFTGLATLESNTFSGSQTITGSVNGNVENISIASSTASIDCSQGNFFTLTLPTGSTHLTATNIIPGQTVSVRVTTQSNTTASIDSSTIKMLGASGYTPTQTGSEDILTFVSFDSSFLYGVVGRFFE